MVLRKHIIFIFLLSYSTVVFSSQVNSLQSLYNRIKSFFITPANIKEKKFHEAVTQSSALKKPLDLTAFYNAKTKNEHNNFMSAEEGAKKFKKSLVEAKEKNSLMKKFAHNPESFLFGVSSSSYQYEGGLDSNNANAQFYINKKWKPAKRAIDFWNRYDADIKQMKSELGINCFRLSIAWERVQPAEAAWDMDVIKRYGSIIKTLEDNGIEPIVVLHHYTVPQWFIEKGGFEKKENISYFVEFAKKMYAALHEKVVYWSTFNAIEGYAFKGYFTGDGPPGKKSLIATQKVMYNMLAAHGKIYEAIKGSKGIFFSTSGLYQTYKKTKTNIPEPLIGLQKNIVLFDPFEKENQGFCQKYKSRFICSFSSLLNDKIYFKLLRFQYGSCLNWIGVNTYSNMFMLGATRQEEMDDDRKTENLNYRDYPEGIYRAVHIINTEIAKPLNIPIIITENGIATTNDDKGNEKRTRFFRRALYTIRKLIEEGCPIIGYTPWASHDNYEWPSEKQSDPYDRPYGMFSVDRKNNFERTLKTGAYFYRDFITHYFGKTIEKDE
jgi:beta-glucosidase